MAMRIVHLPEVIDVDAEDRQWKLMAISPFDFIRHHFIKESVLFTPVTKSM
jgi:hypothetical protein